MCMDYTGLALFSDLDGTLLNSQRQVSLENRRALEQFTAGGGLFGVSTGRAPMNALHLLPKIPINTWSVVLNGAEAYHFGTGAVAFPRLLPKLRTAALIQWVLEHLPQVNILLCSERRLFFLSPPHLADPDFLASHQPCIFSGLEVPWREPWLEDFVRRPPAAFGASGAAGRGSRRERRDGTGIHLSHLSGVSTPGRTQRPLSGGFALPGRFPATAHDRHRRLQQRCGASSGSRHRRRRGQRPAGGQSRRRLLHGIPQRQRHRAPHCKHPPPNLSRAGLASPSDQAWNRAMYKAFRMCLRSSLVSAWGGIGRRAALRRTSRNAARGRAPFRERFLETACAASPVFQPHAGSFFSLPGSSFQ